MTSTKSQLALVVGAVIAIGGVIHAFNAVGPTPNLRLVYAWSMITVIGLYLWGWGTMQYLLSNHATPETTRTAPSSRRLRLTGPPSAQSRTTRRRRDQ